MMAESKLKATATKARSPIAKSSRFHRAAGYRPRRMKIKATTPAPAPRISFTTMGLSCTRESLRDQQND